MRLEVREGDPCGIDDPLYICGDPDHPDGFHELGYGRCPDEAIGHAVRELYLASDDPVVIEDISSQDDEDDD